MSILIELAPVELQRSHSFSRQSEILDVKLTSGSFSVEERFSEGDEALSVGVRFTPQDVLVQDGCVRAVTFFECIITRSSDEENVDPLAKFECFLAATYHLHGNFSPSTEELSAFHRANVIFNCWPYFREFVQTSASRMNIPPPPIPFVKVQVLQSSLSSNSLPLKKKSSKKRLKKSRAER